MIRRIATTALLVATIWHVGGADEMSPPKEANADLAPVALSAKAVGSVSDNANRIEILLTIRDQFEIYAHKRHEFLLTLKVELLDANLQPIECKIQYPEPKKKSSEVFEDFFVYAGIRKLIAECDADHQPAYVRVFYHGYSKRGY